MVLAKKGSVRAPQEFLKAIAAICGQLPVSGSDFVGRAFREEHNESLLGAYLASATSLAASVDGLADSQQLLGRARI